MCALCGVVWWCWCAVVTVTVLVVVCGGAVVWYSPVCVSWFRGTAVRCCHFNSHLRVWELELLRACVGCVCCPVLVSPSSSPCHIASLTAFPLFA